MNPTRRIIVLGNKPVTLAALHTIELKLGPNGEPPSEFRAFAKGAFETQKGTFTFDDVAAQRVLAEAKDYGNDFVVDYAHGTLHPFAMDPALSGKAAGWIPNAGLEVRDGELWAVGVTWTPDAAEALAKREYRYLSPAFRTDENSRIREFINIALTNTPATKRMEPLVLDSRPTPRREHPLPRVCRRHPARVSSRSQGRFPRRSRLVERSSEPGPCAASRCATGPTLRPEPA